MTGVARGGAMLLAVNVTTGFLAWLTLLVVARFGGADIYAWFAAASAVYYGIAGLCTGVVLEVTRSIQGARSSAGRSVPMWQALGVVAGAIELVMVATSPWWASRARLDTQTVVLLAAGTWALVGMAGVAGGLAVDRQWAALAAVVLADSLLRLCGVFLATLLGAGPSMMLIGIVAPGLLWLPFLSSGRWRRFAAVPVERLGSFLPRVTASVAASGCAALVVAGYPIILAVAMGPDAVSAGLLAATVLFRSPLLVVGNTLRPLVLSHLLTAEIGGSRRSTRGLVLCLGACVVTVLAAAWVGPQVLRLTFGHSFGVSASAAAGLCASAVLLVALTLSSVAVIAEDRHWMATTGWLATVVLTVLGLLLPLAHEPRAVLAAVLGPLPALAWHAAWLRRHGKPAHE